MRKCLTLISALAIFIAAQSVTTAQEKKAAPAQTIKAAAGNEETIAKIKKYRDEGEQKVVDNKFTRKVVMLAGDANVKETIKQKWEKMDAYYEGAKLVRIQLYPRTGISERTEEFYLMDDKLVFAFIQDKGPKHEGKDAGESGKEFYFHNDKLIKFEDRSGGEATNVEQQKKMYESRLPYEVADLLAILKKK